MSSYEDKASHCAQCKYFGSAAFDLTRTARGLVASHLLDREVTVEYPSKLVHLRDWAVKNICYKLPPLLGNNSQNRPYTAFWEFCEGFIPAEKKILRTILVLEHNAILGVLGGKGPNILGCGNFKLSQRDKAYLRQRISTIVDALPLFEEASSLEYIDHAGK